MSKDRVLFENGASRSERRPAYHLVPVEAIDAMAERMGLGWTVHGEENWKKGGPEFFAETQNHLEYHWLRYRSGDTSDDHLEATLTNAMMLVWWKRTGKAAWEQKQHALTRCDNEIEGAKRGIIDWEAEKHLIQRG